jgi:hypothetical protein
MVEQNRRKYTLSLGTGKIGGHRFGARFAFDGFNSQNKAFENITAAVLFGNLLTTERVVSAGKKAEQGV